MKLTQRTRKFGGYLAARVGTEWRIGAFTFEYHEHDRAWYCYDLRKADVEPARLYRSVQAGVADLARRGLIHQRTETRTVTADEAHALVDTDEAHAAIDAATTLRIEILPPTGHSLVVGNASTVKHFDLGPVT